MRIKTINILKYICAILFYILMMEYLAAPVVSSFIRFVFKIDLLNFYVINYGTTGSFIKEFYPQLIGLANALLQALIYLILFIGLIFILYKDILADYQKEDDQKISTLGYSLLLYFGLNIFINIICTLLAKHLNLDIVSQNQENLNQIITSSKLSLFIMAITVVIMGPLVEELIFRKSIFKLIKNDYAAIIISSILFGLLHTISYDYSFLELIVVTLPYFSSGIAFGYCYKISNHNIINVYLMHAGLNLLSVLAIGM